MKIIEILVSTFLFAILSPILLYAQGTLPQLSEPGAYSDSTGMISPPMILNSPGMNSLTGEALKRAAKKQRKLYEELFPKPEKFGKGWLLPWQFPKPHNKYTRESFWKQPWDDKSRSKMESLSLLVELSPKELETYLDKAIAETKRMIPDGFLPPDISVERFVLGSALLTCRIGNGCALKDQFLLLADTMAETAKLKLEAISKKKEDKDLDKKISMIILRKVLEPFKEMSTKQIKKALKAKVAIVQEMTAMFYMKCNDWKRLGTLNAGGKDVHVATLAIGLVVTKTESVLKDKNDLSAKESAGLASRLNRHIDNFKHAMIRIIEIETKRKIDKLEAALKKTQNPKAHRLIMKDIEETEKEAKAKIEAHQTLKMKVSCLDVGDNCYAIEMTGRGVDTMETSFPFSLNNIRLRNGDALVSIAIGGNYSSKNLENDLKNVLRKTDGISSLFRK